MLLTDTEPDAAQCVKRLETLCAGWQGQYVEGISISCGLASTEEFAEFDTILKTADERMYSAKADFYRNTGTNRRKR